MSVANAREDRIQEGRHRCDRVLGRRVREVQLGSPSLVRLAPTRRWRGHRGWPGVRGAVLERRCAGIDEGIGAKREGLGEPRKIDKVSGSGVLDVTRQRKGMQLLGDVLGDRVDRIAGPSEAEALDDRIRGMCLKVADDDVSRAHIDLELSEYRTRQADDDDEP